MVKFINHSELIGSTHVEVWVEF